MADVIDDEELIATRKLHGLDDNLFKTEKLWVNNESKLPERLAIYSADNKQIVVENFTKCEYNTQIDKDFFVPKN